MSAQPPLLHRLAAAVTIELPRVFVNMDVDLLEECHDDHLHVYVDGMVTPATSSSVAACTYRAVTETRMCCVLAHASSTFAEVAGLHMDGCRPPCGGSMILVTILALRATTGVICVMWYER
ncbi:hypothetical protein HPB50_000748 [Hyalomma asiaticum]|uniref:Uncharacterized protein n=1 Tax=Hyalomma asiaticum TaxID=266040 RepID=A0ACB7SU24_HYAAI|nr:hypothetical protein HPB50_000748 [Hyalomma asiaticum]